MVKTRKPKNDQDKIAKNIKKRYENPFSEQVAPPVPLNIRQFGLRSKLVLAITLTTFLAVAALSYFASVRARKTQTILGDQLQTTVTESTEGDLFDLLNNETREANGFLQKVADNVDSSASYVVQLFNQQDSLSSSEYWNAEERLVMLPGGQMDNPNTEPASVFIPARIPLTNNLISVLNSVRYLDLIDPSKMLSNSNMVAFYFISTEGATIYYPNIDLANIVAPDFDVTAGIFYSLGTPENNPNRKNIWTPPYQDPAGTGLIVTNVSPIYDQSGKFRGIVAADVQLAKIGDRISQISVAQTGYAFLIDSAGHIIAMPPKGYEELGLTQEDVPVNETPKQSVLNHGSPQLRSVFHQMTQGERSLARIDIQGNENYIAFAPLPITGYSIGLIVPVAELNAPVIKANASVVAETRATIRFGVMLLVIVLLGTVLLGIGFSRILTSSLEQLTRAAQQISAGNLDQTVTVTSRDEIGLLARTFNAMTTQLRQTLESLEQRVTERTRALQTSTEVSRRLSTILDQDKLVKEVVEQLQVTFNYYHVHIYLFDQKHEFLVMAGGTGEAGRVLLEHGHKLPRGKGLVGRAAEMNAVVLVPDVSVEAGYVPNPLLPDTRAEVAIPIVSGENVLGVLDVQHNQVSGLKEEDATLLQTIASQVTIALQNARTYTQIRREAEREALLSMVGEKIRSTTSVDDALKVAVRELGRAVGSGAGVQLKANGKGHDQINAQENVRSGGNL